MTRILMIGRGLAGKLAALYFTRHMPEAQITIIDPAKDGLPIVGESTVEVTVQFLKSLGLGEHLEEDHLHKYGLTYYFRLPSGNGGDAPEYIQHEAPGVIRLPSYNLNRYTFDAELDARIAPLVTSITGRVQRVNFPDGINDVNVVELKTTSGECQTLEADFVIDCSGRARVLTKQLKLQKESPYQRSSFWFRLIDFDRNILNGLKTAKIKHHCFDSYYVTHHFYGHGYWIWIIPMRSTTGEDMVSFGITYRSEMLGKTRMDFEELCSVLERDHPKLKFLITSGRRIEESRYYNYMYEAQQYYDRSGNWFLLGDSGFTFDPANSAGIAYLGHQITQIASVIKKRRKGSLTPCYVEALEMHLKAQLALQDQWSNWYEVMNDPVKMAWTLLVANMGYFHLVVPNFMSGAHLNAGVARQVSNLIPRFKPGMQPPVYPFPKLLDALAMTNDPGELIRRAPSLYEHTVPFSYYRPDDIPRGKLISRYFRKRAMLRMKALSLLNVSTKPKYWLLAFGQSVLAVGDILRSKMIGALPWIYEKEHAACAKKISGFEPPHTFLFPEHSEMGMENSRVTRRSQSMARERKDKAELESMHIVEEDLAR
jgi:flavin-dependent dehydrogenase